MPRENRKRGKKHKKQPVQQEEHAEYQDIQEETPQAGPSWIVQTREEEVNPEAPFGYVEPDVKGYFRTVEQKLREWQESRAAPADDGEDAVPNEERRLFLVAALTELSGKEKQLATDPDCSNVLERMVYSMDDFVRRVFMDRLAGSYEQLSRHRFASHVVQTLLTAAKGTTARETRGIVAPAPESDAEAGSLPTLSQLVLDLAEELLPNTTSLIIDRFASHVLRALYLLLCPSIISSQPRSNSADPSVLRSKKSAKHRAKQGPMKSVLADNEPDSYGSTPAGIGSAAAPAEFADMARRIVDSVRDILGENEVRALAANNVACPVLALLLEMESLQGRSNEASSLMDSVSCGLISSCLDKPPIKPEPSDYVTTLLREPTSSHLLERLALLVPDDAFDVLWEQYFQGKLHKLAVHPVANFVVARAIERLNEVQLLGVLSELDGTLSKIIKTSRTGVLRALVDRAAKLNKVEGVVCKTIVNAFGIDETADTSSLVPCILHLKSVDEYKDALTHAEHVSNQAPEDSARRHRRKETEQTLEPSIQGSLLVQSLLKLHEPHNRIMTDSLCALPAIELLSLSHNSTGSRIIDVFLDSPTVPSRAKRKLLSALIGYYHLLVDDRIGSRVGDRCWAAADPYLKEKIALSLIPQEQFLAASFYGKFFARGLQLYLLKKDPEGWKVVQAGRGKGAQVAANGVRTKATPDAKKEHEKPKTAEATSKPQKRKRQARPEDEIDAVFSNALGKKAKKGKLTANEETRKEEGIATSSPPKPAKTKEKSKAKDRDLDVVFGAIRSAPKDLKGSSKKKK